MVTKGYSLATTAYFGLGAQYLNISSQVAQKLTPVYNNTLSKGLELASNPDKYKLIETSLDIFDNSSSLHGAPTTSTTKDRVRLECFRWFIWI